jgi:hypothetical protein
MHAIEVWHGIKQPASYSVVHAHKISKSSAKKIEFKKMVKPQRISYFGPKLLWLDAGEFHDHDYVCLAV